MEIAEKFFGTCQQQFDFLRKEYGFKRKANKTDGGTFLQEYANDTTAVEIALEWREQYIYVSLCRLVGGRIKENPIIIRPGSELYCFNLENLLLIKDPARIVAPDLSQPLSGHEIERILGGYADALRLYASDILRGDFHVFPLLEKIVKDRAKQFSSEQSPGEQHKLAA